MVGLGPNLISGRGQLSTLAPTKIRLEADFWSPAGGLKPALGDGAKAGPRVVFGVCRDEFGLNGRVFSCRLRQI